MSRKLRKSKVDVGEINDLIKRFEERISVEVRPDVEIGELKQSIIEFINLVFKVGTMQEKLFVFREVMKYLFPTKREMRAQIDKREIIFNVHKEIAGDYGYRDNISEDGIKSRRQAVTDAGEVSSE